jgi:hypothetical protein
MRYSFFRKLMSVVTLAAFLASGVTPTYAQPATVLDLPKAGDMVNVSASFVPPMLKGINVDVKQPFKFDFILDTGNSQLNDAETKDEANKLIRYFLASLTIPEKDLWVNLSPYEKDRIINDDLSLTEMGRDMLAQDYILKQITASLIYPENETGKEFWKKVYEKAYDLYGTTEIPVDTFNKVWIMPDQAEIYENGTKAFVTKATMKVMLESDYLAMENNQMPTQGFDTSTDTDDVKNILRDVVVPILEKEVNEGQNFSSLRQIYYSLILAKWYKDTLKDSILNRKYSDQGKVQGVDLQDKDVKQKIYAQYLEAFKKGVFNYVKEEQALNSQELIPRKYFSGGVDYAEKISLKKIFSFPANGITGLVGKIFRVGGSFDRDKAVVPADEKTVPEQEVKAPVSALEKVKARQRENFERMRSSSVLYQGRWVQPFPEVETHATSSKRAWKMVFETDGYIMPQPTDNLNAPGVPYVFLSTKPLMQYAERQVASQGGQPVVLEFDFKQLQDNGIIVTPGSYSTLPDPDTGEPFQFWSWTGYDETQQKIPLAFLTEKSKGELLWAFAMDAKEGSRTVKAEEIGTIAKVLAKEPDDITRIFDAAEKMAGFFDGGINPLKFDGTNGVISEPEYLNWLLDTRKSVRNGLGPEKKIKAYYYAIGGGAVAGGLGTEKIDLVSPLLATDFDVLIASDLGRYSAATERMIRNELAFIDGLKAWDKNVVVTNKIKDEETVEVTFPYAGRERKVKIFYGKDARREHPLAELKDGYDVLYQRGWPVGFYTMDRDVKRALLEPLKGFLVLETVSSRVQQLSDDLALLGGGIEHISKADGAWTGVRGFEVFSKDNAEIGSAVEQLTSETLALFAKNRSNELSLTADMEGKYGKQAKRFGIKAVVNIDEQARIPRVYFFDTTQRHEDVVKEKFGQKSDSHFGYELQAAQKPDGTTVVVGEIMRSQLMFDQNVSQESIAKANRILLDVMSAENESDGMTYDPSIVNRFPDAGYAPYDPSKELYVDYYKDALHRKEFADFVNKIMPPVVDGDASFDKKFSYEFLSRQFSISLADDPGELKKYLASFESGKPPSEYFDPEIQKKLMDHFIRLRDDLRILAYASRVLENGRVLTPKELSALLHYVFGILNAAQMLLSLVLDDSVGHTSLFVEIMNRFYKDSIPAAAIETGSSTDPAQRNFVKDPVTGYEVIDLRYYEKIMDGVNEHLKDLLKGSGFEDIQLKVTGPADDVWLHVNVIKGRKIIGHMRAMVRKELDGLTVQTVDLDPEYQRQKIGTNIYIALNASLGSYHGGVLRTSGVFDVILSPANPEGIEQGQRLWESLVNQGLAKKLDGGKYEMLPAVVNVQGGIDFNSDRMDLQRTGQRSELDWGISAAELENVQISGLVPVIIQITPVGDLSALLGVSHQ